MLANCKAQSPTPQIGHQVRRLASPGNVLDFHSLKSPFLDFIVIQTGYWPDSNPESIFIIKNIFVMKNVTDFRKTVETSVDPRLRLTVSDGHLDFQMYRGGGRRGL